MSAGVFNAGSITGTMGLDISPFTQSMMQAQSLMSLFPGWVTAWMANPLTGLIATAKETASAILEVATRWDDVGESAQRAGTGVEFFSTVSMAATDAGVSIGQFQQSLIFMNRATAEALGGDKGLRGNVAQLGISIQDMQSLAPEDMFFRLVDALGQVDSVGQQTALTMQIFGRGGVELGAFLGQGSEAIRRMAADIKAAGGGVSEDQARMGDQFKSLETIVRAAWMGIKSVLAESVFQFFGTDMEGARAKAIELARVIRDDLRRAMDAILPVVRFVMDHFQLFATLLGAAVFGKIVTSAAASLAALGNGFVALAAQIVAATEAQTAFNLSQGLRGAAAGVGVGTAVGVATGGGMSASFIGSIVGTILGGLVGMLFGPSGVMIGMTLGGAAGGWAGGAIGNAAAPAQPQQNFSVNVQSNFDPAETSTQIAGKLKPALVDLRRNQELRMNGVGQAVLVKSGL